LPERPGFALEVKASSALTSSEALLEARRAAPQASAILAPPCGAAVL